MCLGACKKEHQMDPSGVKSGQDLKSSEGHLSSMIFLYSYNIKLDHVVVKDLNKPLVSSLGFLDLPSKSIEKYPKSYLLK